MGVAMLVPLRTCQGPLPHSADELWGGGRKGTANETSRWHDEQSAGTIHGAVRLSSGRGPTAIPHLVACPDVVDTRGEDVHALAHVAEAGESVHVGRRVGTGGADRDAPEATGGRGCGGSGTRHGARLGTVGSDGHAAARRRSPGGGRGPRGACVHAVVAGRDDGEDARLHQVL